MDILDHLLKRWTVKASPAKTVVNIIIGIADRFCCVSLVRVLFREQKCGGLDAYLKSRPLWGGCYSPKWQGSFLECLRCTSKENKVKLTTLIQPMKAKIAGAKPFVTEGRWEETMALAGQIKAWSARRI